MTAVAWQYRFMFRWGEWSDWKEVSEWRYEELKGEIAAGEETGIEIRALGVITLIQAPNP